MEHISQITTTSNSIAFQDDIPVQIKTDDCYSLPDKIPRESFTTKELSVSFIINKYLEPVSARVIGTAPMSRRTFTSRRLLPLLCASAAFIISAGCAGKHAKTTSLPPSEKSAAFLEESRDLARKASIDKDRSNAKSYAKLGIASANACIEKTPDMTACYYWRAVNTGLYYKIRIIGYQDGIKKMISDCEKIISLDPKYANAGAYRMLGEIYTQLPQTGAHPDSVVRDLTLAEENLKRAVELAPDYPENHLALADALYGQMKITEAISHLDKAKQLSPLWKTDISYDEWTNNIGELQKKLAKAVKKRGAK